MVSIHRPLGYGPSTLPLRHSALHQQKHTFLCYNHKPLDKECGRTGFVHLDSLECIGRLALVALVRHTSPCQPVQSLLYFTIVGKIISYICVHVHTCIIRMYKERARFARSLLYPFASHYRVNRKGTLLS